MVPPPLRYLDIFPVDHDGEQCFCISDPDGFVSAQVIVSPAVLLIAAQLDGVSTLADIQADFSERTGGALPVERIAEVISFLDEQGFLASETFFALQRAAVAAYRAAPAREAYFADKSYPADPAALRAFLDDCFLREGGPGALPNPGQRRSDVLRGLVVPHIDFHRGGHSYGHGYAALAEGAAPKTVLVFGVAHNTPPVPFILTRKDFDTPLGAVPTDAAAVDRLAAACAWDPFEHELVHRTEHSIEFHAVMLRHLYGPDVRMIPVLCGHFESYGPPADSAAIGVFLDACKALVDERPGEIAVIASADLSHMGRRFGDDYDIDDAIIKDIADADRTNLADLLRFDAEGWYGGLMDDGNARRVCGINCIYSTLHALGAGSAELLHYDAAPDPAGGVVSFASVALH